MIVRKAVLPLLILAALALAARLAAAPLPKTQNNDCEKFQRWFAQQPGSQLSSSLSQNFDEKYARPRKVDNILDYNATPFSNYSTAWYISMKHYRIIAGNQHCMSGFYDSAHKTALIFTEGGTRSDLAVTVVTNAPAELPIHPAPSRTRNGVSFGMTVAQVEAIDGPGTLRADGRYQRLAYTQDFKKTPKFVMTSYLGFLFANGKLVAADVGGGI